MSRSRTAVVHLRGDLVIPTARGFYRRVRAAARQRDVDTVVLDFSNAGRMDSSGVAVVALGRRLAARGHKSLELEGLAAHHRAALELMPHDGDALPPPAPPPGFLEQLGERVLAGTASAGGFLRLFADTCRQAAAVAAGSKRLPEGALLQQAVRIGVDAIFIVGLLIFLLGMTLAFQAAMQLRQFGADVFVADLLGVSMVREFAPILVAIILTGRSGAAIAAELGTMRVRSEIDALTTMGISPVRFLVVPRLVALTVMLPALTLMAMFIGIGGGMVVALLVMQMPVDAYWFRTVDAVLISDIAYGLGKSFVFAWLIGLTGSFMGLRTGGDASGVGMATTRTVVVCVFLIVVVDAVFATIDTWGEGP